MKLWLIVLFLFTAPLLGETTPTKHEAFFTQIGGQMLHNAVQNPPPAPVNEIPFTPTEANMNWIPGYWIWNEEIHQFSWVCGVWRRSPPGHIWISGYWKQFEEGWVRVPGFWSSIPEAQISYIESKPPDPIAEAMGNSPGIDLYWNPGYWNLESETGQFNWVPGKWQPFTPPFNQYWVLVPTHYTWRHEGYVLIPSYFDWPIDQLGQYKNCPPP